MEQKDKNFIEDSFDIEQYKKEVFISKNIKFKQKSKKIINILTLLIILIALAVLFLVYRLGAYFYALNNVKAISEKSKIITAQVHSATPLPTATPSATPTPTVRPVNQKFLELRAEFKNNDIIAHIQIENTAIDYPIVQSEDNDFYLYRDLNKEENIAGSIFMDFRNSYEDFDSNTIVYGHNMRTRTMFHDLRYYISEEYYKDHKNILLKTPYEDTLWVIFSFYKTDINFNYIQTHFASPDEFYGLAEAMKEKSLYDTDIDISKNDKILTLSTCTNEEGTTRYAVHAKLLGKVISN